MEIVIFGASGMIGHGALLEALDDPDVGSVRVVGRRALGMEHPKLVEIVHDDFLDLAPIEDRLTGLDACLWCLGVSAAGMSEEAYRRVTRDFTLVAARVLLRLNPLVSFCFVSGAGTDSTGTSRAMWARVKGETENALLEMAFSKATMFRPGYIQPRRGVRSRTRVYRLMYAVLGPLYPVLRLCFGGRVMTTATLGRALLTAAQQGAPQPILEARDVNALAARSRVAGRG